jgi:hypothetical protein
METDKSMTRPVLRRPDDDNDGLVALPPVPLVRQRLRASVKEFALSQPGRRAAALAAVWIAATGCEADLNHYDPEEALRTYRLIESELRAELRISLGRAITNEPHAATRNTMISMLEHLEELEAAAVARVTFVCNSEGSRARGLGSFSFRRCSTGSRADAYATNVIRSRWLLLGAEPTLADAAVWPLARAIIEWCVSPRSLSSSLF